VRGVAYHNLDQKGRLIFPLKYREDLGDSFVVAKGLEGCLWVYSNEDWEALVQKITALPTAKRRKMERFFSTAVDCLPDGQGRITLPLDLRAYASISKEVAIVGLLTGRYEIWDAETWRTYNDNVGSDDIAALMEEADI
jgi:MraZ protein